MADLLPLTVWEANLDEQITYLNRAGLEEFGYSQKEIEEGISVLEFIAPEDRERAIENLKEVMQGGEIKNSEYTLVKSDGTRLTALTFSSPIVRDNEIQGARGVVLDITERKEAQERLEQATLGTLQALNRTIEAKDEYTGDHIDRVQKYSIMMGREVGLSDERLEQLRYASILHDIGKIGVPDSVLGKPDELTEEEWKMMEKHPKIGEKIVGQVNELQRAAKIVGQHQEHYDGSGYPGGLSGEEITLEARIIAVVDAWDAMGTDRPYRKAIPRQEAIKELQENAGIQFDPEIVERFLEMVKRGDVEYGE
jgi:PAS domain S-box-containing protein